MTPPDIRALRQALGLSVAGFGRAFGVTRDYVGKLERGQRQPSATFLALCHLAERVPAAAELLREWGAPKRRGRVPKG